MNCTETKRARSPHQPTGQWITKEKRLAIYLRDGFSCLYCGADLRHARPADVTLDHLIARSAGGNNTATNLITACRSCNSARGAKLWTDYAPGGAVERITLTTGRPLNYDLAKALIAGTAGDAALEQSR